MADLPRIPSDKPIVIKPVAGKEFPDKYIVAFGVRPAGVKRQTCDVVLQAYDYDTKELSESEDTLERFSIPDIWAEAARSTAFRQVMGGLIQVVMLEYKELNLKRRIEGLQEGPDRDAAIIELEAVWQQLGVTGEQPPAYVPTQTFWAHPDGEPPAPSNPAVLT